jgi:hypothetical protein
MTLRERKERVYQARVQLRSIAQGSHGTAKRRLQEIDEAFGGKTLEEQEAWLTEALKDLWRELMPTAGGLYGVLESYIHRTTGMTVKDFLWLRDYDKKEGP